ncbi:MAG: hypothetical protein ACREMP_11245 [Candidatus Tyrphobacter sp.]
MDLAAVAGVTISTLRRFDSGRNVGFQAVAQIALALHAEREFTQLFPAPEARSIDFEHAPDFIASALRVSPRFAADELVVERSPSAFDVQF